ncbi:hypothetical protein CLV30_12623 [Haloactinopolyspora alba]|uniref:DUF2000 family protein n=1 Tax=Haloactinopolyspora alba TaxID=648780 RepID=A0A2P8DGK4_9ACTN|nr:DUF2000 domain-containing protein [Haloactinopolyspora alba]PSK96364.1 hypothetical protein CLV30_12623 [Haloactinopolyspora alba]
MTTNARFDTKIAVALREDLATWQRLNVTAFLSSGIAADDELLGEPYADADGTAYTPMFRQPVLVFEADGELITRAHRKAVERGLTVVVFTEELFTTAHDEANRAAVGAVGRDDLALVGLGLHGPRNAVDKILKGARLHG